MSASCELKRLGGLAGLAAEISEVKKLRAD